MTRSRISSLASFASSSSFALSTDSESFALSTDSDSDEGFQPMSAESPRSGIFAQASKVSAASSGADEEYEDDFISDHDDEVKPAQGKSVASIQAKKLPPIRKLPSISRIFQSVQEIALGNIFLSLHEIYKEVCQVTDCRDPVFHALFHRENWCQDRHTVDQMAKMLADLRHFSVVACRQNALKQPDREHFWRQKQIVFGYKLGGLQRRLAAKNLPPVLQLRVCNLPAIQKR